MSNARLDPVRRAIRGWLPLLLLLAAGTSFAADKTAIPIGPGPTAMSAEEKALQPDPGRGAQHSVILLDETDRDESTGTESNLTHHVRIKIFSNEARDQADVEIPLDPENGILKKWWGFTLLLDGSVREVRREELKEQELARTRGDRVATLRVSLPGVAPGCVLDYGYVIQDRRGIFPWLRVELQQAAPVKEFHYRWMPYFGQAAAYRLTRAEGLNLTTTRGQRSVLILGRDLPPVVSEPWMPPAQEAGAAATFYYRDTNSEPKEFWDLEAKRLIRRAHEFAGGKAAEEAVGRMNLPAGADLSARLKAAYEWVSTHVRDTGARSAEEAEAEDDDKPEKARRTARDVLAAGAGTGRELDYLFLNIAQVLGAEANLVLAADRTEHYFDPGLLTTRQLDWGLVAVRQPGQGDDQATFIDIGSGLPYGEIPWWLTGAKAFLAAPEGHRLVMLPAGEIRKTTSDSRVRFEFNLQDGSATVKWSRRGAGQHGFSERRHLRTLNPDERQKRLDELCGAQGRFEVSRAEAPELAELFAPYHLECEGTMLDANFTEELGRYTLKPGGPWIEPVPELTSATRINTVVFEFPRIDQTVLDFPAPPGFEAVPLPPAAPVESPFGRYALFVTANPEGFHLERVFALTALAVPSRDYEPLRRFLAEVHKLDGTRLEFRRVGSAP